MLCSKQIFLESVKKELFNPKNVSLAHDNLSVGERKAFSRLKNLDEQVIKIQDKGSKFVILDKKEYSSKMLGQLENPIHHNKLHADPSASFVNTISEWSNKWLQKGQIDQNIANWVVNNKTKPGKAFSTIKTHKEGNPLRLITSCCGTAIENLSAFTEFYLKPLAQTWPSFVKDTTHLLQKIEDLNKSGPFPEGTLLVSWDVVSMFPNVDNNLGIKAVTDALHSRENQFPSTECIVEAVKICLQHNNSHFQEQQFLSRYLFLCGHELASSFRLFRLHKFFLQMITNFSKRHITFVVNVIVRSTLLNNSPLDIERFVGVLECPNVFRQFSLVPLAFMSKRCCVISVVVFEISGEAYV